MQIGLQAHPTFKSDVVTDVYVNLNRSAEFLDLWFVVQGEFDKIVIPQPINPRRADNLWQSTCFELFLRSEGLSYEEFNFSPSGQWAAYVFRSYRTGMNNMARQSEPTISVGRTPFGLETHVTLSLPSAQVSCIGLSAIIEQTDGTKSYWALAHPDGPPDFHHDACFVATLPPIAHS